MRPAAVLLLLAVPPLRHCKAASLCTVVLRTEYTGRLILGADIPVRRGRLAARFVGGAYKARSRSVQRHASAISNLWTPTHLEACQSSWPVSKHLAILRRWELLPAGISYAPPTYIPSFDRWTLARHLHQWEMENMHR